MINSILNSKPRQTGNSYRLVVEKKCSVHAPINFYFHILGSDSGIEKSLRIGKDSLYQFLRKSCFFKKFFFNMERLGMWRGNPEHIISGLIYQKEDSTGS